MVKNMNKKLLKLEITGFVFVSILGTIMHFVFNWSSENKFIALFCPVNESPWEHLKLLFFPYLIYTVYEQIKLKQDKFNIYFAKYIGAVCSMWSILSLYYTVGGALGKNISWVNILSFFIGTAGAFIISYIIINSSVGNGMANGVAGAMLIVTAIVFFIFTFEPPIIPLFQDPQNFTYGI